MSILDQIEELSPGDSIVVMEALWNRMKNAPELESPEWHQEELARRDRMVAEGTATFSDWEEAKRRILSRVA